MTTASPALSTTTPVKPKLRGVSHKFAFFVSLVVSAWLVGLAKDRAGAMAAAIYGASVAFLFGVSALYHRIDWRPDARRRMRSLDHAAIFVMIAGGFTPLFLCVPSNDGSHRALAFAWIGAALGVAKSLAWPNAPKWMTALVCVALGWTLAGPVLARAAIVGAVPIAFIVASGTVYSLGAVVYALKKPDPLPTVFGYHEIFHAMVIAATALHVAHVALVLRASTHVG